MSKFILLLTLIIFSVSAQASTKGADDMPDYKEGLRIGYNPDPFGYGKHFHKEDKKIEPNGLITKDPTVLETLEFQRKTISDAGIENIKTFFTMPDTQVFWIIPNEQTTYFSRSLINDFITLESNNIFVNSTNIVMDVSKLSKISIVMFGDNNWQITRDLYQEFMTNFDIVTHNISIRIFKINNCDIPNQTWRQLGASSTTNLWEKASPVQKNYLDLLSDILQVTNNLSSYLGETQQKYSHLTTKEGFDFMRKSMSFF